MVKNANFLEPMVRSSVVLFCLINSPKYKDIQFTIMFDKERMKYSHYRS